MKVHEIMTAHARCVGPDNALVEAAGLMRELDVGALPVCEGDRLAGMVTDRDIVVRGVADGRDVNEATVRDVMSPGIFYVFADQEVEDASRMMQEKQIRRLPVLNREKRLVGIVTLGDLALTSNPAFSGEALREISESPEQHLHGGRTPAAVRQQARQTQVGQASGSSRRTPAGSRKSVSRSAKSDTSGRTGGRKARGRGTAGKARKAGKRSPGGGTAAARGRSRGKAARSGSRR
jgi:CBS domain-containing protein